MQRVKFNSPEISKDIKKSCHEKIWIKTFFGANLKRPFRRENKSKMAQQPNSRKFCSNRHLRAKTPVHDF